MMVDARTGPTAIEWQGAAMGLSGREGGGHGRLGRSMVAGSSGRRDGKPRQN